MNPLSPSKLYAKKTSRKGHKRPRTFCPLMPMRGLSYFSLSTKFEHIILQLRKFCCIMIGRTTDFYTNLRNNRKLPSQQSLLFSKIKIKSRSGLRFEIEILAVCFKFQNRVFIHSLKGQTSLLIISRTIVAISLNVRKK